MITVEAKYLLRVPNVCMKARRLEFKILQSEAEPLTNSQIKKCAEKMVKEHVKQEMKNRGPITKDSTLRITLTIKE